MICNCAIYRENTFVGFIVNLKAFFVVNPILGLINISILANYLHHKISTLLLAPIWGRRTSMLANNLVLDEIPHYLASHQDLHFLL